LHQTPCTNHDDKPNLLAVTAAAWETSNIRAIQDPPIPSTPLAGIPAPLLPVDILASLPLSGRKRRPPIAFDTGKQQYLHFSPHAASKYAKLQGL